MSYEHLTLERDGPVTTITLQRPRALNAITLPMAREVLGALQTAAADPTVGAVVLTGAGRAFSAGADLKESTAGRPIMASGRPDLGWILREVYHPLILTIREMPQPVVAAVNGVAAGIGCSIALASDLVFAARSASFMLAFVRVALVPDGGASLLVTARSGVGRAAEMAMTGEQIGADQALRWNLISRVEDDEALLPAAQEAAARLASGPPEALAAIKELLNAPWLDTLRRQLDLEAHAQSGRSDSDEVVEAVAAFRERRLPRFGAAV